MHCPYCHQLDNRVVDSRLSKDGASVRRRRQCDACGKRFTTYERVEESLPFIVKKDGTREAWSRHKVASGLQRACEKRPVSIDAIEAFISELEMKVQELGQSEVSSRFIGEEVMGFLREADQVAYVRFASVYRSFKDIEEFMDELQDLLHKRSAAADSREGR
jgi:transcriptional repressor NrdR